MHKAGRQFSKVFVGGGRWKGRTDDVALSIELHFDVDDASALLGLLEGVSSAGGGSAVEDIILGLC